MTVTNAAPVVSFSAASATTFPKGGTLAVQGSFSDKGALDQPWTYTYSWGDGKASTTGAVLTQGALPTASHVYTTAGTFNARLTVVDKDGKSTVSKSVMVTVTP